MSHQRSLGPTPIDQMWEYQEEIMELQDEIAELTDSVINAEGQPDLSVTLLVDSKRDRIERLQMSMQWLTKLT